MDLWQEGRLAESAWDGFLKARKYGTYKIQEILETGTMARESSPLKRRAVPAVQVELEEPKASIPIHSIRPHQLIEIEELEEEIEELEKQLDR